MTQFVSPTRLIQNIAPNTSFREVNRETHQSLWKTALCSVLTFSSFVNADSYSASHCLAIRDYTLMQPHLTCPLTFGYPFLTRRVEPTFTNQRHLSHAIQEGHVAKAQDLLVLGFKLTPLDIKCAIDNADDEMIKLLSEYGIDLDVLGNFKSEMHAHKKGKPVEDFHTPLSFAITSALHNLSRYAPYLSIIETLLKAGADSDIHFWSIAEEGISIPVTFVNGTMVFRSSEEKLFHLLLDYSDKRDSVDDVKYKPPAQKKPFYKKNSTEKSSELFEGFSKIWEKGIRKQGIGAIFEINNGKESVRIKRLNLIYKRP